MADRDVRHASADRSFGPMSKITGGFKCLKALMKESTVKKLTAAPTEVMVATTTTW
ncbi:MAG: hypothetical protein H6729_03735 [Deltaproteobacteria bacterium]|nr:hypothetical protein [Deltaproteobacteria bacterium]